MHYIGHVIQSIKNLYVLSLCARVFRYKIDSFLCACVPAPPVCPRMWFGAQRPATYDDDWRFCSRKITDSFEFVLSISTITRITTTELTPRIKVITFIQHTSLCVRKCEIPYTSQHHSHHATSHLRIRCWWLVSVKCGTHKMRNTSLNTMLCALWSLHERPAHQRTTMTMPT